MDAANRQTHLGPCPNKFICIIDEELPRHPTERPSSDSSSFEGLPVAGPAFILGLPQELLIAIIELAIFRRCDPHGCPDCCKLPNAECAKALSRVCRRVSRIAQPMLFHNIKCDGPPSRVSPRNGVLRLHRSLQENPSLRKHCRRLSISVLHDWSQSKAEDWAIVDNLSHWLTRIRCLASYGVFEGFNEGTQDLVQKLMQNMGHVRHWRLYGEGCGLYLDRGVGTSFPKLEKLEIDRMFERETLPLRLDPKSFHTASFTSLSLSDYEGTPHSIALLLQSPVKLENFEFGSLRDNLHTMNYPMFQSWLSVHSQSLKSINIGYLSLNGGENKHIFDATLFPALESLTLSRWEMSHSHGLWPFTAENEKLLAPQLKIFGWNFYINDQHTETWSDFGDDEVAWLRQLAKCALVRKAALRTIKIGFHHWGWECAEEYPWARMVNIRDELWKTSGIEVVGETPRMSESEWRKRQLLAEAYEEAQQVRGESRNADSHSELELDFRVERRPEFYGRDIREYFRPL